MSGFRDIGPGMEDGSGRLAIGSFPPVRTPYGFRVTGDIIRMVGFGVPGTGDTGRSRQGAKVN